MEDRRQSIRQSGIPRSSRLPTLRTSQSFSSLRPSPSTEQPNRSNGTIHNPKLRSTPSHDRLGSLGNTTSVLAGNRKPETPSRVFRLQGKPLPPPPRSFVGPRSSSITRIPASSTSPVASEASQFSASTATPSPPAEQPLFKRRTTLTRRPSDVAKESFTTPSRDSSSLEPWASSVPMDLPSMPANFTIDEEESTTETIKPKTPRSRPSLSERTIETLSQIPSSPANRGRRPSAFFEPGSATRSGSRPASRSSLSSRPGSSYRSEGFNRPTSRSKSQTRPGSSHRIEDTGPASFRASTSHISNYKTQLAPINGTPPTQTKPRVGVKTTRAPAARVAGQGAAMRPPTLGKIPTPASRTLPKASFSKPPASSRTPSPEKQQVQSDENKPMAKTMPLRPPKQRPSLNGLFRKPPALAPNNQTAGATPPKVSRKTSLVSHRSSTTSGDDTVQSGPSPTSTATSVDTSEPAPTATFRKSSAALREQIAKAKAAKKATTQLEVDPKKMPSVGRHPIRSPLIPTDTSFDFGLSDNPFNQQQADPGSKNKVLEGRLVTARTSGRLNIAALGLREIPAQVLKMYDSEAMGINDGSWAETVDLTRFVAADNELEMIDDAVFPDKDPQAFADDEDGQGMIFGGLETLDLHGNMLISLPIGLRRLHYLTSLNLSSNRITNGSFEVISQITSLRDLKLGGNLFYGPLDNSFTSLVNLETVDLHDNNISALPAGIVNMRKLRILNLGENNFETLPLTTLAQLPLTELVVRKNKLSGVLIDDADAVFQTLQILDVSSNQLTHILPPSCSSALAMPSLHQMCVSMNWLQELPGLGMCANLLTLNADENSITDVPNGLTGLTKLRHVDFSSNDLRVIPPEISRMDNLNMLRLSGNPLRDKKFCSITTEELKDILAARLDPDPILNEPEATFSNLLPSAVSSSPKIPATRSRMNSIPRHIEDGDEAGSEISDKFATPPTSAPQSPAARSRSHTLSSEQWTVRPGGVLDRSNTQSSALHPVSCSRVANEQSVREVQLHHNLFSMIPESLTFFSQTLVSLSLSHNKLMGESYMGDMAASGGGLKLELLALRELNLSSNHITSLAPLMSNLISPGLQKLDVSTNRIAALPSGTGLRDVFPELSVLLIANNHLADLEPEAIKGMRIVDASNNDIAHLNPRIGLLGGIENGALERLDVMGNRFRVPRYNVLERGTEATLRFLRSRVPVAEMAAWREARGAAVSSEDCDAFDDSLIE
ncbi:hypothetical protein PpBr36_08759 [Pyricularia pennisetigena]|uniref:hypothetical protein n=1 Tax=Pyricularia pennisetigena TaxID=1578925 RepID=UPI00114E6ECE|nr:hypothetical protein PpBr36_08759 [Pyricularia pennisetigena]TLS24301.1 hypothetical protein PpBr36_08759 [Pyricularia pennisetigena]